MARLKALLVIQCRDYIHEQHGADGIARVKARMDPGACARVYAEDLVSTDWIEVTDALEHARAYDRVFATAEGLASERMLSDLVVRHYEGIYRSLLATAPSPMVVLEKSSRLWNRFYDSGETQLVVHGPTSVTKRLVGCPDLPHFHDLLTTPYYAELVRQAGGRDVIARHVKCVATGADCCETSIRWRD